MLTFRLAIQGYHLDPKLLGRYPHGAKEKRLATKRKSFLSGMTCAVSQWQVYYGNLVTTRFAAF
jgi:hypothetical protein